VTLTRHALRLTLSEFAAPIGCRQQGGGIPSLLACSIVACFTVLASAQASAPPAIHPPLREAPSFTIIQSKSITLRYSDGTPHVMPGMTSIEIQGPPVIEADSGDVFIDTDAVLRGSVTMRSASG